MGPRHLLCKGHFSAVCSESYAEFKEIKILVATVSWITRMECGPQFVLTHILYVLSWLSFKRLFSHVCFRLETKELLFEASWVGIDDEELIFPFTSNYLSILVSAVPRFCWFKWYFIRKNNQRNCINFEWKILKHFITLAWKSGNQGL